MKVTRGSVWIGSTFGFGRSIRLVYLNEREGREKRKREEGPAGLSSPVTVIDLCVCVFEFNFVFRDEMTLTGHLFLIPRYHHRWVSLSLSLSSILLFFFISLRPIGLLLPLSQHPPDARVYCTENNSATPCRKKKKRKKKEKKSWQSLGEAKMECLSSFLFFSFVLWIVSSRHSWWKKN